MKAFAAVLLAAATLSGCVVVPAYDPGYRPYGYTYGYYDRGYPYYGYRYRHWDRY